MKALGNAFTHLMFACAWYQVSLFVMVWIPAVVYDRSNSQTAFTFFYFLIVFVSVQYYNVVWAYLP